MRNSNPKRTFTLAELLIVIGIVMLVLAIAIPNFLQSRAAANQASAISTLRAIHAAQTIHKEKEGAPGTLSALVAGELAPQSLEDEEHSGYGFAVVIGRRKKFSDNASAVAWPLKPGLTGSHVCLITPDGKLFRVQRDWNSGRAAKRFAKKSNYHNKFNEKVLTRQKWALVGN
jgi:type II secretory pathway pseudopilin PulG